MKIQITKDCQLITGLLVLVAGISCALLGCGFTALSWLITESHEQQLLGTLGNVTVLLTIPLVLLSACCLDRADADEHSLLTKEDNDG